jgi:riboflavin biosynthesis pyrimidine reductase
MTALQVLWERPAEDAPDPAATRTLAGPLSLAAFYGGPLTIALRKDRPTIVANFVATLDGVVSFGEPGAVGGGAISGGFAPDRRLMALLRCVADAVLVGAGTVRPAKRGWTPRDADPELAAEYSRARRCLRLAPSPTTFVVSGSGNVDLSGPGLGRPDLPVVVVTTRRGMAALPVDAANERVRVVADGDTEVTTAAVLGALHAAGARLVVCEGGPHLLGRLLVDGAIDELFLTVAPQVAGRGAKGRLGLVEQQAFDVAGAPWSSLVSVRRADDHLFLRYRFDRGKAGIA